MKDVSMVSSSQPVVEPSVRLLKSAIVGVTVALAIGAIGIFAPILAPHDPFMRDLSMRNLPPVGVADGTWSHILGTDTLGRDVLSRIIVSFRIYLVIGLTGCLLGTFGAWLLVIIRGTRGATLRPILGVPLSGLIAFSFVLSAALSLILGHVIAEPSPLQLILFVGACSSLLPMVFVYEFIRKHHASSGVSEFAILPGVKLIPMSFSMTLLVGLFTECLLSYFGFRMPPPTPTLGTIIEQSRIYILELWWISGFPLGITLAAVGAFLSIVIPATRTLKTIPVASITQRKAIATNLTSVTQNINTSEAAMRRGTIQRGRIVFTGSFLGYSIKGFLIAILMIILAIPTLSISLWYIPYWSVKYFFAHMEIELPQPPAPQMPQGAAATLEKSVAAMDERVSRLEGKPSAETEQGEKRPVTRRSRRTQGGEELELPPAGRV